MAELGRTSGSGFMIPPQQAGRSGAGSSPDRQIHYLRAPRRGRGVMGDQQQGRAGLARGREDQLGDPHGRFGIEAGGGLVGEQDRRRKEQGASERHTLHLAPESDAVSPAARTRPGPAAHGPGEPPQARPERRGSAPGSRDRFREGSSSGTGGTAETPGQPSGGASGRAPPRRARTGRRRPSTRDQHSAARCRIARAAAWSCPSRTARNVAVCEAGRQFQALRYRAPSACRCAARVFHRRYFRRRAALRCPRPLPSGDRMIIGVDQAHEADKTGLGVELGADFEASRHGDRAIGLAEANTFAQNRR